MSKYNYEITDLEALAKHDAGKFVTAEEIKVTKIKPRRDLIKAALTLGVKLPGVVIGETTSAPEVTAPEAKDGKTPFQKMMATATEDAA